MDIVLIPDQMKVSRAQHTQTHPNTELFRTETSPLIPQPPTHPTSRLPQPPHSIIVALLPLLQFDEMTGTAVGSQNFRTWSEDANH